MRLIPLGFALVLASAAAVRAQAPHPNPGGMPSPDPIGRLLFPPELVMQHQEDIGLTDAQRTAIQKELIAAQTKFTELQWKMTSEVEKLTRFLAAVPVDEATALEQLDRVLATEREVKRAQIGLLVRIKNGLTREQQARLDKFRGPGEE
jgi:Spy/CpxP family protein refolding chaperone